MAGKLYLCATPIGNLEDITYRVVRTLNEVDLIGAEDTRNSIKLLNHFDIKTPMTSYHEFNKYDKAKQLVEMMKEGKNIAIITDAGTPGISDPGEEVVRQCFEAGIQVTSLPGPAACITALTMSGQKTRRFCFEAFLPKDKKEKVAVLEELKNEITSIKSEKQNSSLEENSKIENSNTESNEVNTVKKEEKTENTNSNKVEENQSKNKTNTVGYSKYYGTWENESNSSGLEIKSIENNVIVFTWFIYRIASIDDVALPIENNKAVFYYSGVDDSNYNNVIEDNEHYYRKAILELKDNEVTVTVEEVTAEEYSNNLNLEKEFSGGVYITEGEYVYNKK